MIKKPLKIIGIIFVAFLILGGLFIYTMNSNFNKLGHVELNKNTNDTIPFRYSNSGHILIDVSLEDNNKTYPFILDSGASNMIFKNQDLKIDLESNGYSFGIGSSGNIFWTGIKKINQLQIGNLKFKNLHVKSVDFNFECLDAYGIIGIGLMRHLVWQIDFEKNIIIISDKINDDVVNQNSLQFELSENSFGHQLSIPLKLSKTSKSVDVTVDLGNNSNLSLDEKYILRDSLSLEVKKIFGRGSSGLGDSKDEEFNEKLYLIDTLGFLGSEYKIHDFPIITSKGSLNLLGLGFFKKYKTTISWKDKKLIIEPYDSIQNFRWKTSGFGTRFKEKEKKIVINSLIEDSPTSNLNISMADEILSINGFTALSEKEYCQMKISIKNVDTLKLEFINQDTHKNMQIVKQPIF